MYDYGVFVTKVDPGYWVICPDIPEMNSVGDTEDEALHEATDGLITALSLYIDTRRPIPSASKIKPQQHIVQLPTLIKLKLALWQAMHEKDIKKSDLAKQLNVHPPQVDRLLDLLHSSKLDPLENALESLGKRLSVSIKNKENPNHESQFATTL